MVLPVVDGWLIDYLTAEAIFDSKNNQRISHCIDQCAGGQLKICHHEEKLFKAHTALRQAFLIDQNCICWPDQAIMQQCVNVSTNAKCKEILAGNLSALPLTAIASSKNYGVISDHRSIVFTTVYDLCDHYGIHVLSADKYFALLP